MKYPNRSMYLEGIETIILTCISNRNPPTTYLWYFNGTSIHAGNVFEIKNGRESESGQYICNASNLFHGTVFEASNAVNVQITSKYPTVHKCRRISKNSNSTDANNQEMNTYFTIDDTSYERIGPLDHHPYQEIFQISSTQDCKDKNSQYLTAVSIQEENQKASIITLP
ncbi:unnamed protein product [Mytilus coruscus]|uniref:Ig-like domain-containing protein n=1 Tax=Mytilus coruscus TaxID=42192 RepID=A0A6J8CWW9_MYTCO|nr:unnamed protein product [Mytilus coruscus]